jgi:hypothetical protein
MPTETLRRPSAPSAQDPVETYLESTMTVECHGETSKSMDTLIVGVAYTVGAGVSM